MSAPLLLRILYLTGLHCQTISQMDNLEKLTKDAPCQCGVVNRAGFRIVGGEEAEKNEYPWQVGLVLKEKLQPFCGGVILSSNTIITSAHCVCGMNLDTFDVVVGEHAVSMNDGQAWYMVCNKTPHPRYHRILHDNDLALLILCTNLTFRKEVSPICLPTRPGPAYDKVVATVSGWGKLKHDGARPDKLREISVKTMSNEECNAAYNGTISDNMICAGGKGKDSCTGDSGGPMITRETGGYFSLIGVVSWGMGCADPNYPGVYARVTQNLDWIRKTIQGTTCQPLTKDKNEFEDGYEYDDSSEYSAEYEDPAEYPSQYTSENTSEEATDFYKNISNIPDFNID